MMKLTGVLCAVFVAVAASCAWCDLPAALVGEGVLLGGTTLGEGLELGVYGPKAPTAGEAMVVTVVIMGNQTETLCSGVVVVACEQKTSYVRGASPPAAWYIPFGQWSPDRESEWRQLLVVNPEGLWATRIVAMAHPYFRGSAGVVLDRTVLSPDWPRPAGGSVFYDRGTYSQIGVGFITDERMTRGGSMGDQEERGASVTSSRGAHGVKVSFPLILKEARTTLTFWTALRANEKVVSGTVVVRTGAQEEEGTRSQPISAAPIVEQPAEGAVVGSTVKVIGKASPGRLVVAWLEDPQRPEAKSDLVRHIADSTGRFEIVLPVPWKPTGDEALVCELHVRIEAPDYESPETVRRVRIR